MARFCNLVMNFTVSIKAGNFMTGWWATTCSRKIMWHGVYLVS